MVQNELAILKPYDRSKSEDDWPCFQLTDVTVSLLTADTLVDALDVSEQGPFRVRGQFAIKQAHRKYLKTGVKHTNRKEEILIPRMMTYSIEDVGEGSVKIWVLGKAAFYEIFPAPAYVGIYERMWQKAVLWIFLQAYTDDPQNFADSADMMHKTFLEERRADIKTIDETKARFDKHHFFLLCHMLQSTEREKWQATDLYKIWAEQYPESVTKATQITKELGEGTRFESSDSDPLSSSVEVKQEPKKPGKKEVKKVVKKTFKKGTKNEPTKEPTKGPTEESAKEPTEESAKEPTKEPTEEPKKRTRKDAKKDTKETKVAAESQAPAPKRRVRNPRNPLKQAPPEKSLEGLDPFQYGARSDPRSRRIYRILEQYVLTNRMNTLDKFKSVNMDFIVNIVYANFGFNSRHQARDIIQARAPELVDLMSRNAGRYSWMMCPALADLEKMRKPANLQELLDIRCDPELASVQASRVDYLDDCASGSDSESLSHSNAGPSQRRPAQGAFPSSGLSPPVSVESRSKSVLRPARISGSNTLPNHNSLTPLAHASSKRKLSLSSDHQVPAKRARAQSAGSSPTKWPTLRSGHGRPPVTVRALPTTKSNMPGGHWRCSTCPKVIMDAETPDGALAVEVHNHEHYQTIQNALLELGNVANVAGNVTTTEENNAVHIRNLVAKVEAMAQNWEESRPPSAFDDTNWLV